MTTIMRVLVLTVLTGAFSLCSVAPTARAVRTAAGPGDSEEQAAAEAKLENELNRIASALEELGQQHAADPTHDDRRQRVLKTLMEKVKQLRTGGELYSLNNDSTSTEAELNRVHRDLTTESFGRGELISRAVHRNIGRLHRCTGMKENVKHHWLTASQDILKRQARAATKLSEFVKTREDATLLDTIRDLATLRRQADDTVARSEEAIKRAKQEEVTSAMEVLHRCLGFTRNLQNEIKEALQGELDEVVVTRFERLREEANLLEGRLEKRVEAIRRGHDDDLAEEIESFNSDTAILRNQAEDLGLVRRGTPDMREARQWCISSLGSSILALDQIDQEQQLSNRECPADLKNIKQRATELKTKLEECGESWRDMLEVLPNLHRLHTEWDRIRQPCGQLSPANAEQVSDLLSQLKGISGEIIRGTKAHRPLADTSDGQPNRSSRKQKPPRKQNSRRKLTPHTNS